MTREQVTTRFALGIGSVGEYLEAKRCCPSCEDASHQRVMGKAEKFAISGPAEIYKCGGCGCVYEKSTGAKLTFA